MPPRRERKALRVAAPRQSPMARRRKSSLVDDCVELMAMLPWWASLLTALVAYLVLHQFASQPPPVVTDTAQMQGAIFGSIVRAFATVGQYVVPIGCVAAAVMSFVGRQHRSELLARTTGGQASSAISGMSWQEFELLIGEALRVQGYEVTETGGGGADGGVDLVLRKGREKFLVQCKQWKAFKVGVREVRELYGLMAAHGAAGGFVITSGRFTEDATAFAAGRNVRLVDGTKLDGLLKQATSSTAHPHAKEAVGSAASPSRAAASAASDAAPLLCPVCSGAMVLRTAKRGANAGGRFWGCSGFSAGCRGTRPA